MLLSKSLTSRWLQHSRRFSCRSLPVLSTVSSPSAWVERSFKSQDCAWKTPGTGSRQFCCTASSSVDVIEDDHETVMADYFAMFGVPRRYALDPKELQQSYRNLMAKYHPDRRNQQQSMDKSNNDNDEDMDASQITNAYQTLREPHTRATYLLELVGHPMEETTNAASLVPPEFLLQVMEWREAIDSIETRNNDDDATKELEELLRQAQDEMESVMIQLDVAFHDQDFDRAMQLAAQLQYWHRIEETIQDKM